MIEKLKEVEKRYDDISEQLLEPDVYNDQARYTKLMKEHKMLTPLIEKYREYKSAEDTICLLYTSCVKKYQIICSAVFL